MVFRSYLSPLAAILLVACGHPQNFAPQQATSASILSELQELSPAQQESLYTAVGSLPLAKYFAILIANASDNAVSFDGVTFSRTKSTLTDELPMITALAKTYPTVGAMRTGFGQPNGVPTLTGIRNALSSIDQTPGLGLVTSCLSTKGASLPKTWLPKPVTSTSLAGRNAIESAGANYAQVGIALKRYQEEADRQQAGWDAWMGQTNLAVQTQDQWGKPIIVSGHPSQSGPTSVQTVASQGQASIDITSSTFACYQQQEAAE